MKGHYGEFFGIGILGAHALPTKTCPNCSRVVKRRRDAQFCPYCGIELFSYRVKARGKTGPRGRTIWVANRTDCRVLVRCLQHHIRTSGKNPLPDFEFSDWPAEMGMAHLLLDMCEGSQTLAEKVIDSYFDSKIRAILGVGNTPKSMGHVIYKRGNIGMILAQAKKDLGYDRADRLRDRPVEHVQVEAPS